MEQERREVMLNAYQLGKMTRVLSHIMATWRMYLMPWDGMLKNDLQKIKMAIIMYILPQTRSPRDLTSWEVVPLPSSWTQQKPF